MRHRASMITTMEGLHHTIFRITQELSQNSRSGLTVRFLSKKLELPEEEIEYLVDVHHDILYTDITKIKLVAEGFSAVKRITDGLEDLGDVASLYRKVKSLSDHDFRRLEEKTDLDRPAAKKGVVEFLVNAHYRHPDSIVAYVATKGFSTTAKELFDIVWQSKEGIMPVPKIRAAHSDSEYDVEQALWELFRGAALFEMFRFDSEDRLVRVAGLLSEIRQLRETQSRGKKSKTTLKQIRTAPGAVHGRRLQFSDMICRLVATIAARPARVRGDGELFREDWRRLSEIVPEGSEPSLGTCLWAAEGVQWLARVDNELRAGELEKLIDVDPLERHRILFEWLMTTGNERESRQHLTGLLDQLKSKSWLPTIGFIQYAMRVQEESEQTVLKAMGGHHQYVSPSAATNADKHLARSLEDTFFWLGFVERSTHGSDSYFRVTEIGRCMFTGSGLDKLKKEFARRSAEIVVQPNFDIVVPLQDMDPLLTVPLDQFTTRQSTGQATVYHLDKDSFTLGLQEGHDGEAFVEFLLTHNRRGALPSNVMKTLEDWRGGLRRVHLSTIQILETSDPLVMADLVHRKKYKKFLTEIDTQKMVLYSKVSNANLIKQLEKDGFIVE